MKRILHVISPDKFTIPLVKFISNNQTCIDGQHQFLAISNNIKGDIAPDSNIYFFKSPIRKSILYNLRLLIKSIKGADVLVLHGAPVPGIFFWMRNMTTVWVIYGSELYGPLKKGNASFFKEKMLKNASFHFTHVEGDSKLANSFFKSKAKHLYSPMYLSNIVGTNDFKTQELKNNLQILIGNSCSPNNDHITVLNNLLKYKNRVQGIISPLSYGSNLKYRDKVIEYGKEIWNHKFRVILDFLPFEQYKELLSQIDVAVFNHWRQEAMGVTLTLLSLGKVVYLNEETESYKSLKERGFIVYSTQELFKNGFKSDYNVEGNKTLLERYYSKEVLVESYSKLASLKGGK